MKALIALVMGLAHSVHASFSDDRFPHVLPGLTAQELIHIFGERNIRSSYPSINQAKALGERNLAWLANLNANRPKDKHIPVSDPMVKRSYPIDKPMSYSPATVADTLGRFRREMPQNLQSVLWGKGPLPKDIPVDEPTYIDWMRQVDRLYSTAVRWAGFEPWLEFLTEREREDLRGYYHLGKVIGLKEKLDQFAGLPENESTQLKSWLLGMCFNDGYQSKEDCQSEFNTAVSAGQLWNFYSRFWKIADELWRSFFSVQNPRAEFVWRNDKLIAPFRTPESQEIMDLLSFIEVGWQTSDWFIDLDYGPSADVRVRFVPGVTPNVNEIGGNLITMDGNIPVLDPMNEFVIQHEFGHVLGFRDCYVEFYDANAQVIINYQLDITDMMCSRAGVFKERHFLDLKEAYQ